MVRSASILKRDLKDDGAARIAERSRGTPRIANRLLRRVRHFVRGQTAAPSAARWRWRRSTCWKSIRKASTCDIVKIAADRH